LPSDKLLVLGRLCVVSFNHSAQSIFIDFLVSASHGVRYWGYMAGDKGRHSLALPHLEAGGWPLSPS
jgi:hypothetical protein